MLDNTGLEYRMRLEVVGRGEVLGQVVERRQAKGEPAGRAPDQRGVGGGALPPAALAATAAVVYELGELRA